MTTVFVHGFNYNLANGDNPEQQYRYWREFASGGLPFAWQSTPADGVAGAWLSGHWNRYHWAWSRAVERAAPELLNLVHGLHPPVDVVCHSLGSRVVYAALALWPEGFRRVLTLNGADSAAHARACMQLAWLNGTGPHVLCVMTRADDVLRDLGRLFTPVWGREHVVGYDGLAKPWPRGWHELDLGAAGDGPGWGDHDHSFKDPDFWPLWRAWLDDRRVPSVPPAA